AGTSIIAPIAPPPQPTTRRRVTLPLYQKSFAHSSSFHFSVITSPPSGSHGRRPHASHTRTVAIPELLIWTIPSLSRAPATRLATCAAVRAVTARSCRAARSGIVDPSPAGP